MPDLRYSRCRTLSDSSLSPSLTGPMYGSIALNSAPPSPLLLPSSGAFLVPNKRRSSSDTTIHDPPLLSTLLLSFLFLCAGVADVTINRYLLFVKTFHYPLMTAVSSDAFALILLLSSSCGNTLWSWKPGKGKDWICRILTLGILSCMNHALDMFGLMLLPATFVKTIRSSKPLFAAGIMFLMRGEKQSFPKILCLLLVATGASLLTFKSNSGFDLVGASCVLSATVFSAMHFVLASIIFQENEMSALSVMVCVTSVSMIVLIPFCLYYESDAFRVLWNDTTFTAIYCLLFSALSKFMHSILAWLLIQRSNPVYCTSGVL